MAQQMITLEEAAEMLGISPEEMKKRLKTDPDFRRLSQIRDGTTVRFKHGAIEELARQLGLASDAGLPLAPMEGDEPPGSDDFKVQGIDAKKKAKKGDEPLDFGSSSTDDVFSLTDDAPPVPTPKSSGKLTPNKPAGKSMSDSSSGSTDSDVRLGGGKSKKAKSDEAAVPTEEIALDFSGPGSAVIKGGSSAKLSAPKSTGSSGKLASTDAARGANKPPADSSEFELSLDADSDDFELKMNSSDAGGDEVDLGSLPKEKASGASSGKRGASSKSGINLRDPADSGIPLDKEKAKGKEKGKEKEKDAKGKKKAAESDSDSDVDFELSLDSSAVASSTKLGAAQVRQAGHRLRLGQRVRADPRRLQQFQPRTGGARRRRARGGGRQGRHLRDRLRDPADAGRVRLRGRAARVRHRPGEVRLRTRDGRQRRRLRRGVRE